MTYKIINLEQNTPEWHQFRSSHIGGSEAAVICGVSPFKDSFELFYEKTGFTQPQPMNARMQRGHDLEPEARSLLIEKTGVEFTPIVLESTEYPFISCSLDGINDDFTIMCEIKCPSKSTHEMALNGEIPKYYIYQIQHCIMVSNALECYYFSYNPDHKYKSALVRVGRDQVIIKKIIEKEIEFWRRIVELDAPEGPGFFFE